MTPTKEAIDAAVEAMRNTPVSEGPHKVAENMLRAALDVSEADTRRLDWLISEVVLFMEYGDLVTDTCTIKDGPDVRSAIDAAMQGDAA